MNLFDNVPDHLTHELADSFHEGRGIRIERIVSKGHCSPEGFWYDQDQAEWVIVLKGAARLEFEGKVVQMGPGDYLDIPAHTKHRVAWTTPDEPTIWLAVHYSEYQQAGATPHPPPDKPPARPR